MKHQIRNVENFKEGISKFPLTIINSTAEIKEKYEDYFKDESRFHAGQADALVFAQSEKQIIETLQTALEQEKPVTISGGRTGIVGGAVPNGGILLSLDRMNRFRSVHWDAARQCWCIRVEPGISIEKLQYVLDQRDIADFPQLCENKNRQILQKFRSESDGWFYPPDPTEKSAHLGGTVATNASGARSLKYGQTRIHVVSLRVVLADGAIFDLSRGKHLASKGDTYTLIGRAGTKELAVPSYCSPNIKNAAGYFSDHPMDIIDLFIGSEGTLGVISEIGLLLRRKPELIIGGIAFFRSENDAFHFVRLIRESGVKIDPSVLEFFDSNSLHLIRKKKIDELDQSTIPPFPDYAQSAIYFEQESQKSELDNFYMKYNDLLFECGTSMEEVWGGIEDKERVRMMTFRHLVPEIINSLIGQRQMNYPNLHKIGTDFVLPMHVFNSMLDFYKSRLDSGRFEYVIFGHIGENHLHVNIIPRNEEEWIKGLECCMEMAHEVVAMGGSISGEHGIGKIKKYLLDVMYDKTTIEEMRQIKRTLDPKGLIGRDTLF